MKLKLFLIISAVVAAVYAVINPFMWDNQATIQIWSVLIAIGVVLPAIIALIAQRDGFKAFLADYLSMKRTDWRKAIAYVVTTAVAFPVIVTLLTCILGNLLHLDVFGRISTQFRTFMFGFMDYSGTSAFDVAIAVGAQIVYLMIAGSIIGIISCICEEMAWRGFMVRYLKGSKFAMAVITGLVWTLWWLAMAYVHCDAMTIVMTAITNIVISYYLVDIAGNTGSVWTCAMVRGIFSLGAISACYIPGSGWGLRTITLVAILIIIAFSVRICKPDSKNA